MCARDGRGTAETGRWHRAWPGVWAVAVAVAVSSTATRADAAAAAADVCADLASQAAQQGWGLLDDAADEAACRKPWARPDERLSACDGQIFAVLGHKLQNVWNRFVAGADASWATWGPRGVGPELETGTIVGGFKRTFFGAGIADATSVITVTKTGGRARAHVTVCRMARDGRVVSAEQRSYANGTGGVGTAHAFDYANGENTLVGVVVDTPVSINSFSYSLRLTSEPRVDGTLPVGGIADLHMHQYANLGFGGRFYWGDSLEPLTTGVAREVINGDTTLASLSFSDLATRLAQLILDPASLSVDANVLLAASSGARPKAADGFYTLGTEGHPTFVDWPHHADRSHQQAHISWIRAAHTYGTSAAIHSPSPELQPERSRLNLLVVSVVNNDTLCSVLKVFDRYGNAPLRDAQGAITGWRSASWGCTDHENVVRQLDALQRAEQTYPWYRIAMNPWHARRIIREGDLAVVVSLEVDKPLSDVGGNYGDWRGQLDLYRAMGLTTMQIVHESNSPFAGAAIHRDLIAAVQAIQWPVTSLVNFIENLISQQGVSPFDVDDDGFNERGLTDQGAELVDALVARNMPIDLAHGSLRTRRAVMGRVPDRYGLYDSHTKFERLLRPGPGQTDHGTADLDREKTFMVLDEVLAEYVADDVLVGLRTAPFDLYAAPTARVSNDCPGSAKSFAQAVQFAHEQGLDIAYGTDFNTGVAQLGPRFGAGACWTANAALVSDPTSRPAPQLIPGQPAPPLPAWSAGVPTIDGTSYYEDGLASAAWLPELTRDLVGLGTPGAVDGLQSSAEAFLRVWERAYTHGDAEVGSGSLATGSTCTRSADCRSGLCREGRCRCRVDGDCASWASCETAVDLSANVCVSSVECTEDSDCGADEWCDAGLDFTQNTCKAKLDSGEVCGVIGEIGVGHRCKSGKCRVRGFKLKCK